MKKNNDDSIDCRRRINSNGASENDEGIENRSVDRRARKTVVAGMEK